MTEPFDRRRFLALASTVAALPSVLAAQEKEGPINSRVVANAEKLVGLEFTEAERELMMKDLAEQLDDYKKIREVRIDNSVPPALRFDPLLPGTVIEHKLDWFRPSNLERIEAPSDLEDLAFLPVIELNRLIHRREVSSVDVTKMYLGRLKRLDPVLHAVVTLTEERALEQAERVDAAIEAGRGQAWLGGVPWGAKDLLAVRGYPTTWGSVPFKEQVIDMDAAVVERLDNSGAVLLAKLSLGELAWGDVWFGGMTRNPWKLEQGSSGSSAGSAAATAAGCVAFSIGSETLGSIVSPCTRTGTTGLRPTFGRVSRHGAMALSWSMDKIGPICRTVEDCAAVFRHIIGADHRDPTTVDAPFRWEPLRDVRELRVGYVKSLFEAKPQEGREEWHAFDLESLEVLSKLGIDLKAIELPDLPISALSVILTAEASAAFDELTRSGKDDLLVRQIAQAWPNVFRVGQTIPAVAYIQANRIRTLAMREMEKVMSDVDVYVVPTYGGSNLLLTNLTGHPAVVVPNGFRKDGTPTSITFTGKLFGEGEALLVAKAYQDATGFHLRRPKL
ncbi:MAG TPA: amidase, partial [Thermoanaerobaculia bacterium]